MLKIRKETGWGAGRIKGEREPIIAQYDIPGRAGERPASQLGPEIAQPLLQGDRLHVTICGQIHRAVQRHTGQGPCNRHAGDAGNVDEHVAVVEAVDHGRIPVRCRSRCDSSSQHKAMARSQPDRMHQRSRWRYA